jgi:hypothetical protein
LCDIVVGDVLHLLRVEQDSLGKKKREKKAKESEMSLAFMEM